MNKRAVLMVSFFLAISSWGPFVASCEAVQRYAFSGGRGVIYTIEPSGDLYWHNHTGYAAGTNSWGPNKKLVGNGWDKFSHVFSAYDGVIYAIDPYGNLFWYKHLGQLTGEYAWAKGSGSRISTGWDEHANVFSGGRGVIYGINFAGNLFRYRHAGYRDGTDSWGYTSTKDGFPRALNYRAAPAGSGWGGRSPVFSGSGDGITYGIDSGGDLYRYDLFTNGSVNGDKDGVKVGEAWGDFNRVFSGTNGVIYGIKRSGELFWYKKDGSKLLNGGSSGVRIGDSSYWASGERSLSAKRRAWEMSNRKKKNVLIFVRHAKNGKQPWNLIPGTRQMICGNFDKWETSWGKSLAPGNGTDTYKRIAHIHYLQPEHEEDLDFNTAPTTNRFRETANAIDHGLWPNTFNLSDNIIMEPFSIPIAAGMRHIAADQKIRSLWAKQWYALEDLKELVNKDDESRATVFVLSRSVLMDVMLRNRNSSSIKEIGHTAKNYLYDQLKTEYAKSEKSKDQSYFYGNYWVVFRYGNTWESVATIPLTTELNQLHTNPAQGCEHMSNLPVQPVKAKTK